MSKISYLMGGFLNFKLHQRFFNGKTTAMHSTPCCRRGDSCQWDEQRPGMFVMQHNHTSTTHGHIDVGDAISDVIFFEIQTTSTFFQRWLSGTCTAHHAAGGDCQWDERCLGVFVMQHNHTKATHGHIGVGDAIYDAICLEFNGTSGFFTVLNGTAQHTMPQEVIANGMSDTLGVFVMQHNHTTTPPMDISMLEIPFLMFFV